MHKTRRFLCWGKGLRMQGEEHMILTQGKLADGLVDDLLEAIHKYDETLYMATVIGVLELVKQQLITESLESQDDED
jgi:hypothetical protein